jgi:hypothetical protein
VNTLPQRIQERIVEGKRLGRHIRLDDRGQQFRVTRDAELPIRTVLWLGSNREALDQGPIGACTGFASAHALNCSPWGLQLTNKNALDIYALATTKDPWPGSYPDEDTGSSGLAAMQACRELGYIQSWSNAYSLDDVLVGLQTRPGILGISWFDGCDEPGAATGQITPTGHVRGGHEIAIVGCEIERGLIVLRNSWGNGYGVQCHGQTGYFRLSYLEFTVLLTLMGDAIFPDVP